MVWAKLKGFPFWPGKSMRVNSDDNVDVRFFGAHDRAWIPLKDVYLYSEEPPVAVKPKKKTTNLESCVTEVETYIANIRERFGSFEHAPMKAPLDPKMEEEQIGILYPKCTLPFDLGPIRRRARTYSFSGSERTDAGTPTPTDLTELNSADEEAPPAAVPMEDDNPPPPVPEAERLAKEKVSGAKDEGKSEAVDPEVKPRADKVVASGEEDRTAASPPCEVSSTTPQAESTAKAKLGAAGSAPQPPASGTESLTAKSVPNQEAAEQPKKKIEIGVLAGTTETIEMEQSVAGEGEEEEVLDEEEEIDDVEEIDETEFADSNKAQKEDSGAKTKSSLPAAEKKTSATNKTTKTVPALEKSKEGTKNSSDEEIDDVEPDCEEVTDDVEETSDAAGKSKVSKSAGDQVDTSKLIAAGISVTKIDRKKPAVIVETSGEGKKQLEKKETASISKSSSVQPEDKDKGAAVSKKIPSDIGLGSDISVTMVPKKKPDAASLPRISVKKESELMEPASGQVAKKDEANVHVTSKIGAASAATQKSVASRRGSGGDAPEVIVEESAAKASTAASSKSPPDPIVTISKVGAGGGSRQQPAIPPPSQQTRRSPQLPPPAPHSSVANPLLKSPAPTAAPGPRAPSSSPMSVGLPPQTSSPLVLPPGHPAHPPSSLASILGAGPRMSVFRPGMAPPPPGPPPSHPRAGMGSPMMRLPHHPGGAPPPRLPAVGGGAAGSPMGMPSLHPRPPSGAAPGSLPAPPAAGPVSEQLQKISGKLVDHMRLTLEDMFREMATQGSAEAQVKTLQLELEKMRWRFSQELAEAKHNADLTLLEMRQSMEADKQKCLADLKKQMEIEKQKAVDATKKKQWCANCGKEAMYYCCWNTSYCSDKPCQVRSYGN